jgi:hypothetical protein
MDLDTLTMLRTSLEHVLTENTTRPLSERLDELGWDEVLADDAPAALGVLFDVKGRTLSSADALGPLMAGELARLLGDDRLARATVLLPTTLVADGATSVQSTAALAVDGVALSRPPAGASVLVPVTDAFSSNTSLLLTTVGPDVVVDAVANTDPDLGLVRLRFTAPAASVTPVGNGDAHAAWQSAVSLGRWTIAAELVGLTRHVIGAVAAYTAERKQYGRAIGSFQALQHRLASAHALTVGAADVVAEAAATGSAWEAMVAKALAGRAAEFACTQAQQCYGAIGFTWEHEFHRYLRRMYQLDRLLGDYRSLEAQIGRQLLRQRTVPKIGAL